MEYIVEFRVFRADDGYVWQFKFVDRPSSVYSSRRHYKAERGATATGLKALDEELQRRRSRLKINEANRP